MVDGRGVGTYLFSHSKSKSRTKVSPLCIPGLNEWLIGVVKKTYIKNEQYVAKF